MFPATGPAPTCRTVQLCLLALLGMNTPAAAVDLPSYARQPPPRAVSPPAAVGIAPAPSSLECDGLRRLSDNFLLDLQVRMVFDRSRRRYTRFENSGRGWEQIAGSSPYRLDGPHIVLDPNPYTVSYMERLNGTYYYIDRTGTTLSLWGHCAVVGPVRPLF